jgi:hypothetical protein
MQKISPEEDACELTGGSQFITVLESEEQNIRLGQLIFNFGFDLVWWSSLSNPALPPLVGGPANLGCWDY